MTSPFCCQLWRSTQTDTHKGRRKLLLSSSSPKSLGGWLFPAGRIDVLSPIEPIYWLGTSNGVIYFCQQAQDKVKVHLPPVDKDCCCHFCVCHFWGGTDVELDKGCIKCLRLKRSWSWRLRKNEVHPSREAKRTSEEWQSDKHPKKFPHQEGFYLDGSVMLILDQFTLGSQSVYFLQKVKGDTLCLLWFC